MTPAQSKRGLGRHLVRGTLLGLVAVAIAASWMVVIRQTSRTVSPTPETTVARQSVDPIDREVVVYTPIELDVPVASSTHDSYLAMPGDAGSRAPVWAEFEGPGDLEMAVDGFWAGQGAWRIRFSPTAVGEWRYRIRSAEAGSDGRAGRFTAMAPTRRQIEENSLLGGFLEVDESGYGWRLSEGARFIPVGDTQWSWTEEYTLEELKDWVDVVAERGMNTLMGCAWLGIYCCGFKNDRPEVVNDSPFDGGDPGTDRLVPDFFRKLDAIIEYANGKGVMIGLTIGGFPGNSRWYEKFDTAERNDRWFRYVVARYAAYNVRWGLYGEVNEASTPWGRSWRQQVAHVADLVRRNDPYDHPIGSHHTSIDTWSARNADIGYVEAQVQRSERQYLEAIRVRKFAKPVWFEEYWYESLAYDDDVATGTRNTHRNFVAAMAFPTMGSLVRAHHLHGDFPPYRATEAGVSLDQWLLDHDEGLRRMGFFAEFFADVETSDFEEWSSRCSRGPCGRFGDDFAVFLEGGGSTSIDLTGREGRYAVRRLDVHTGEIANLGTVEGEGPLRIESRADTDVSLLLRFVGR